MKRLPTVFISSRMEELAMERRAAFAAVAEAGLTPLVFETEPTRQEKDKIDLLVDRADFFVGLYYITFGTPSKELFDLSPIEYELLRFYARFDVVNSPESYELSETDRKRIDKALEDADYRREITKRIKRDFHRRNSKLGRTSQRIKLFQRVSNTEDLLISSRLSEFLHGLSPEKFGNAERDPPADASYTEKIYPPSHVTLFEKIYAWSIKEETISLVPIDASQSPSWKVFSVVRTQDRPGLLYFVLRGFFDFGLNIDGSWAMVVNIDATSPSFEMTLQVRNFHFLHSFRGLSQEIPDEISYDLLGHHFSILDVPTELRAPVSMTKTSEKKVIELMREATIPFRWTSLPKSENLYYYSISAYDVPGALMEIARLVYHFAGSILFVCSGRFASELVNGDIPSRGISGVAVSPILLGIQFPQEKSMSFEKSTFEYELLSLLSVTVLHEVERSWLQERFVAWKTRNAAIPDSR